MWTRVEASEVVAPTAHCVPGGPQEFQSQPNHQQDDPYGQEGRDTCDQADDQKDDAEKGHAHRFRDADRSRQRAPLSPQPTAVAAKIAATADGLP